MQIELLIALQSIYALADSFERKIRKIKRFVLFKRQFSTVEYVKTFPP